LEAEDIQQRNIDYEVKEYLPNFLMIGDNGGGVAILMDNKNQNIILFFSLSLLTNHRHSRLRENDDG